MSIQPNQYFLKINTLSISTELKTVKLDKRSHLKPYKRLKIKIDFRKNFEVDMTH